MKILALEVTNRCNRACRHCFRNRADPPESLSLDLAEHLLMQAKPLGIRGVCLTGGEIALYPHLGDLLHLITAQGFRFTLVTNGYCFEDRVLHLLLEPEVKASLATVCLSLDGATAASHDALRGGEAFAEAVEAAVLCREHHLPLSLKSLLATLDQDELEQLAHLGVKLGAHQHEFLFPFPTPALIREGLLPPPEELEKKARWVKSDLAGSVRSDITVDGLATDETVFNCGTVMHDLNVDYQGNLILCCQLSHVTLGDGVPNRFGGELVADLKEISLREGIIQQYRLAVKLIEERLENSGKPLGISHTPCHWCLYRFGKLDWLKEFPDSPWAQELLPNC